MVIVARALMAAALAAALAIQLSASAAAQSRSARQLRADRATAQHLAALMPEAIEGWKAMRPKLSWRDNGAEARVRYWAAQGHERFTLVFETRSRGLTYKMDLLDDPDRAARQGYTVKKIGGHPALTRERGGKSEVRFWLDDRILALAVGRARLESVEAHLEAIDFEKLAKVK